MKRYIKSARTPKQVKELVLQGNYGYGWDDLTYYDDTPQGRKEMREDYKAYAENEGIPLRTITRKSANPDYVEPENNITYADAISWVENSPYVAEKQWSGADYRLTNLILKPNDKAFSKVQLFIRNGEGDDTIDDTVEVRNIETNRTKRVYSIDELEKAVAKIMNR